MRHDYVYDLETFPNVFTMAVEHAYLPLTWSFEISDWKDDSREIIEFLEYLSKISARMVGFNNVGFDYPILHTLVRMGRADADTLYRKCQAIIGAQDGESRWAHSVKTSDWLVPQIDLFKIHHFDNKARSTSLKALEFNMRLDTVQDLPFKVGTTLTREQADVLHQYNAHDVMATKRFYHETLPMIEFREVLSAKYRRDFMNHNDTKIGKDYFIMELEKAGVGCYDFGPDGRTPRQTLRPVINLKDAILPWIKFQHPAFTEVLEWFKSQTITETKGVFKDKVYNVNGFSCVFGLGGIHGSVTNRVVESDDTHVIIDLDVSSYYPNLAITNGFYPEHLGGKFVTIYKNLYEQRKKYPKGSAENAMLKLALNGVYGDSNNKFSVFYDPLFTMKITLNGQLLLCILIEKLLKMCPGVEVLQINTDGLTVRVPRGQVKVVNAVAETWEKLTGLTLEHVQYKTMCVRDVNSYIAVRDDGTVKRKGAYEYDVEWHQNASALVVAKVAEQVLVHGVPIRSTIENWPDVMDFMIRVKVPRSSMLSLTVNGETKQIQNMTRYYVAEGGGELHKWMPPLKGDKWRKFAVEADWKVCVCNDVADIGEALVDIEYYVQQVEKLTLRMA